MQAQRLPALGGSGLPKRLAPSSGRPLPKSLVCRSRAARAPQRGPTRAQPVSAVAEAERTLGGDNVGVQVTVDNDADASSTLILVEGANKPGLLGVLTSTFTDLGLDVVKAEIGGSGKTIHDRFWVVGGDGKKLAEAEAAAAQQAIEVTLTTSKPGSSRPKLSVPGQSDERSELLHTLMGALALRALGGRADRRGAKGPLAEEGRGGHWIRGRASDQGAPAPPKPGCCGCVKTGRWLRLRLLRPADTYIKNDVLNIQQSIVHRECGGRRC